MRAKSSSDRIKVGITTGDINGVGPEIIAKCFSDKRLLESMTPIIYGGVELMKQTTKALEIGDVHFNGIKDVESYREDKINVVNIWKDKVEPIHGKASKESGKLAFESLKRAVDDLAGNKIDVLVTCPIDKSTIQNDEFKFPGHTEYLAKLSNVEDHLMLLVSGNLRVGVVTGHIPLKEVSAALSADKIVSKIRILNDSLIKDFGIVKPRIAVLGLNPHAGDDGLLGEEEKEIITPAVRKAQEEGFLTQGPYGADGYFGSSAFKNFDGVIAMYHDQGLAPFKAMAFETGVNYTAGLPIVRTSPDHGTGYSIAGKNEASPDSLRHAIFCAIDIYIQRRDYREITANPLPVSKRNYEK